VKRRDFIAALGAAPIAWPCAARAEKSTLPVIGFLCGASAAQWMPLVVAFRRGLDEAGYAEGTNVAIDYRWADGDAGSLPALAADLVRREVAIIVASGGPRPVLSAKAATATIPIVFTLGADPVTNGLVASLGRPGGNITGVTFITGQLHAKRLELLRELVPNASVIAALVNPENPQSEFSVTVFRDAARLLKQQTHVLNARSAREIDSAFATLANLHAGALFVASDGLFFDRREQVVGLAARYRVPASFDLREFVIAGGLMSYGASLEEVYRQAGIYTGRILGGAKPADLPVLQPTKFELSINARTAKALRLAIPQSLLLRADEVIE
jgi:putative ABC transport system substrate-binding protein